MNAIITAITSVMQKALPLEPGHEPEDFTIGLARGADDELGRRSDHAGLSGRIEPPALEGEATGQLELRQQVSAEVLVTCQGPHVAVAGRLEVDRHAAGEPHGRPHLIVVGAGQHLQMEVAGESLPSAEDLRGRQHAVHCAARAPGHSRGQE